MTKQSWRQLFSFVAVVAVVVVVDPARHQCETVGVGGTLSVVCSFACENPIQRCPPPALFRFLVVCLPRPIMSP